MWSNDHCFGKDTATQVQKLDEANDASFCSNDIGKGLNSSLFSAIGK